MKDFLYDYPFAFVFLFLILISLSVFVSFLFLVCIVVLLFIAFFDKRVVVILLISSLLAFLFFKNSIHERCNSSKITGKVVNIKFGSHLSFIVEGKKCKLFLFAPSRFDNLKVGDRAIFYVKSTNIDTLKNKSFKRYLFSIGISRVGFVRYAKKIGEDKIVSSIDIIRKKVENEFYYFLPSNVEYFLDSAFLGDSRYKSRIKKDFIDTQTAHILAVSGVHMGFIFGMFYFIFYEVTSLAGFIYKRLDLRVVSSSLALMPTFIYFVISGMHIPAIRSFAMIMLFILAIIFSLKRNSFNILFFIGSIFLVFNLRSIFNPSFVMSFSMTFFALLFYHKLERFKLALIKWLIFLILMSIFAMPLSVYFFGKLSIFSFVYNAIIVPFFGFIIVPSAFLLLVFSFLPYSWFKVFLFKVCSLIVELFLGLVSFLSHYSINFKVSISFISMLVMYIVMSFIFILLSRFLSHRDTQCQIQERSFF